tara:strand:+ start:3974 stop:4543 length:570 start_codon:yes stop_codon:yes gene_type:complete
MTWLVTAIATAAGVSTFTAAAATIGATAAVGTGVISGRSQYVAGKTQEIELNRQAEEERIAAQSRELQRREELNRALAANVVGQSMSGISGEGTPASIALESAKKAGLSESTIGLSEKLKQAQLRRQGKSAKQVGYMAATSTSLKSAQQILSLLGGAGGGGGGSGGGGGPASGGGPGTSAGAAASAGVS